MGGFDGRHGYRVRPEAIQVDQESGLEDKACLKVGESPAKAGDSPFRVYVQDKITAFRVGAVRVGRRNPPILILGIGGLHSISPTLRYLPPSPLIDTQLDALDNIKPDHSLDTKGDSLKFYLSVLVAHLGT